ncbi:hypothetical protein [Mycobacterium deserti]|uniref:Uncharacterized protein n=1 Tax=Mycobacterium deserti TaxID=2978347 RepID=A0ABT2MFU0_9MYCO|nr:hypothetical protein [Mycobacterium deserti]MCT7661143.1 hypothetical protein [Mycobacterium deserti]
MTRWARIRSAINEFRDIAAIGHALADRRITPERASELVSRVGTR